MLLSKANAFPTKKELKLKLDHIETLGNHENSREERTFKREERTYQAENREVERKYRLIFS